ncbi:MaoC family dehydratase [Haloplanus aerogenes]|uniref:Acyl dehydratase n=2 Tax=Haloplanus aerogenes TaxID=660522 RepID=A0A3M0DSA8_9EURY|nr:MaoC family dehydratase [Haloplanus aerogenes]RMB24941.1 acyl dehydratase [Haloplanus aerogenes]
MSGVADTWLQSQKHFSNSVGHFYNSVMAANRAMFPALSDSDDADADADDRQPAVAPELTYSKAEWTFEHTDEGDGVVSVGDRIRFSKRLTEEEIQVFADASGDTNRLHLDADFAEETRFGRQIVHGTLVSGVISAALARLPGLTIYLSQDLQFLGPVDIGEKVTAICEVVEDLGDGRYRLTTVVEDEDGETVIDGEAIVLIDEVPEDALDD